MVERLDHLARWPHGAAGHPAPSARGPRSGRAQRPLTMDRIIQMTTVHQKPTSTTGNCVAPSKPKTVAVEPMKPPEAADIPFPGGYVSAAADGRVKMVIDPP